jgi:hypothetical protein
MASYAFLDRLNKLNEEVYEELAEVGAQAIVQFKFAELRSTRPLCPKLRIAVMKYVRQRYHA